MHCTCSKISYYYSEATACLPGWKHDKDLTEVLGIGTFILLGSIFIFC